MNYNINNNFNQPNFGAIKMIKCSNQDYSKIMEKYGENIEKAANVLFKNRSISDCNTYSHINKLVSNGYSADWLEQNCKFNGIKLPNINEQPLFEFSDMDVIKLALFQIKSLFRGVFLGLKGDRTLLETPEHLKTIKVLNDVADYNYPKFLEFIKKNNAQEVSLEEYLRELAQKFGK